MHHAGPPAGGAVSHCALERQPAIIMENMLGV